MEVAFRENIAASLKKLRHTRKLSQTELAKVLSVSQATLSLLEQGKGSLTAEQLFTLIQRYNLTLEDFIPRRNKTNEESGLQNILIRLGAKHLRETRGAIPPTFLLSVDKVITEVLASPESSRLLTALAPVVVENIKDFHFPLIFLRLAQINRENRLLWFLDVVSEALSNVFKTTFSQPYRNKYRRARRIIDTQLIVLRRGRKHDLIEDPLLQQVSEKSLEALRNNLDESAKKYHILTDLKSTDFEKALKETEKYD